MPALAAHMNTKRILQIPQIDNLPMCRAMIDGEGIIEAKRCAVYGKIITTRGNSFAVEDTFERSYRQATHWCFDQCESMQISPLPFLRIGAVVLVQPTKRVMKALYSKFLTAFSLIL